MTQCTNLSPFSVITARASGEPKIVWSCADHLARTVNEQSGSIHNSTGGKTVIVQPTKPEHRCDAES